VAQAGRVRHGVLKQAQRHAQACDSGGVTPHIFNFDIRSCAFMRPRKDFQFPSGL